MLSSERGVEARCVLAYGEWSVVELALTPEKLKWIWEEMNRFRTLFSDFTRGDFDTFYAVITSHDSVWLEILDGQGQTVGIAYWTDMLRMLDAECHLIFFDGKPAEKTELCREIARWFFIEYPQFHRMTATLPHIYHATIRLAKRIGFVEEGRKRQARLIGGRLVDEVILGLLAEELK